MSEGTGNDDFHEDYISMADVDQKGTRTHPTWTNLKKVEIQRRSKLFRAELPFWRIIFFWKGTCLRECALDPFVWAVFAIYVFIRIYAHMTFDAPAAVELMGSANIDVLGGFLSFFLVLFVNQTQARFYEIYGFSKACSGRIQDVAGLARTQLPPESGGRLLRHLNAAQVVGYVGLNGVGLPKPYSQRHFFGHYNKDNQLITPEEMKLIDPLIMESGGGVMKMLVTWCQEDVNIAKNAGFIDSYEANIFHDRILEFRASMDSIYDYTDQPPHFFYIHFLALLSLIYLPLFSIHTGYSAGWGADINIFIDMLNGAVILLQCIFVIGLKSLGTKMIDCCGSDLEDLSIIHFVDSTLENCNIIMSSIQVDINDNDKVEENLFSKASIEYNMACIMNKNATF